MRIAVEKLVGRDKNGEYYWLESIFDDDGFRGAVGSIFRPVSVAEKEERMSPDNAKDYLRENWQAAVEAGTMEASLDDFVEVVIDIDGESAFFDQSYFDTGCKIAEIFNSELPENSADCDKAEFSECVGGGRCFNRKIVWDKIYDQAALTLALSYETD